MLLLVVCEFQNSFTELFCRLLEGLQHHRIEVLGTGPAVTIDDDLH